MNKTLGGWFVVAAVGMVTGCQQPATGAGDIDPIATDLVGKTDRISGHIQFNAMSEVYLQVGQDLTGPLQGVVTKHTDSEWEITTPRLNIPHDPGSGGTKLIMTVPKPVDGSYLVNFGIALFYADPQRDPNWHELRCDGLPKRFLTSIALRSATPDADEIAYFEDKDTKTKIPLASCGLTGAPNEYDFAAFAFPDWTLQPLSDDTTFDVNVRATAF